MVRTNRSLTCGALLVCIACPGADPAAQIDGIAKTRPATRALNETASLIETSQMARTDRTAEIDRLISAAISKEKIPGLSAAVVTDGRVSYSGAFGQADLENHVAVTENSLFRTASVAKPITATAALALVAAGRLNLDAPIQDYCPAFPEKAWVITSRELLSHRSGIRHYKSETLDDPEVGSVHHYVKLSDAFVLFGHDPLVHQPGTAFLYSTFGYTVLGCVLEGASGESFPALIKQYVFAPAGMRASTIDDARKVIPNRVRGYDLRSDGQLENASCIDSSDKYPAGGLLTTAADLANFIQHLYSGALLPSNIRQEMWTPVTSLSTGRGYALGWGTFSYRNRKALAHSGDQQGAAAAILLIPEERLGVTVLANSENAEVDALAHSIVDAIVNPQ